MEVLTFMYPFRAQALSALTFVMLVSSWFVYALALLQPTGLDSEYTITVTLKFNPHSRWAQCHMLTALIDRMCEYHHSLARVSE